MIAGILWRLIIIAAAIVAAAVHLDRQTIKTPDYASSVPEPFRSSAQLRLAAEALTGEDAELALAESQQLVRSRPLPAENLRLLAQAQFKAGDIGQSTMTIQYAAQRGWRDPLAQEALLRLAIDAGDDDEAARRYTALFLRRDTQDALLEELGPPVLADPQGEGRATLITIVSGGERWHNQFLNRGSRVMPPDAFAQIVTEVNAKGARFDCQTLRNATRALTNRDADAGAIVQQIVDEQC